MGFFWFLYGHLIRITLILATYVTIWRKMMMTALEQPQPVLPPWDDDNEQLFGHIWKT